MNIIDQIKAKIERNLEQNAALTAFLATLRPEGIELEKATVSVMHGLIDIDHPSRRDVEKCLYFLKGQKWDKTENRADSGRLNYITRNEFIDGYRVRLWCADPPATCRLVEEQVEVPAQPARKEIRKRLVCT